jgi:ATP-binding cassette, subfamily C (CFTR/MRP), member 1
MLLKYIFRTRLTAQVFGVAYQQQVNRMGTMFRGATASIIFDKSLTAVAKGSDMPAVTLMSTDVDRMTFSFVNVSEVWALLASIAIGIWLLYKQLGPVSLAPTIIAFFCGFVQSGVARRAPRVQAKWVASIQRRIGITSAALRSMKSIKLGGMVEVMERVIQGERLRELHEGMGFRLNITAQNATGKLDAVRRF